MTQLLETPKHSDLVFDVGMHKGEDSEFYLRKGFRVVAFEAEPGLVEAGRERFKSYLESGQLAIVAGAIVDRETIAKGQTKIRFYRNEAVSVWGTVYPDWAERNVRSGASSSIIEVDTVDFESVVRQHGVPHYMKVDIEGADMVCLQAFAAFRERPDYISLESDKTRFANLRHEIAILAALGYDAFQAIEQSCITHTYTPPNPPREGAYVDWHFPSGSSGLFGAELDDDWHSRRAILRRYRVIHLGYFLFGDDGLLNRWRFPGVNGLRSLLNRVMRHMTRKNVPGWYDTHARLARASAD